MPSPPGRSGLIPPATVYSNYVYHEATGATHAFNYSADSGCPLSDDDDGSVTGDGSSRDGSGFSLYNGASQIKGRGGMIITPAFSAAGGQSVALTDSNGNQITSNGAGVYTDTLGVQALAFSSNANSTIVSYPVALQADSATTAAATIYYVTKTVRTNFGTSGIGDYGSTTVSLVDHVTLADGSTYSFTYESTVGATDGAVTGRIASVTLPNQGTITYAYTGCGGGGMNTDGSPCVLSRTGGGATKSYTHNAPSNGTFTNWTIDEVNNRTDYSFMAGPDAKYYELHRVVTPASGSTPTGPDLEERDTYYNSDWNRSQPLTQIGTVDIAEAQNGNRLNHTTAIYNVGSGLMTSYLTRDVNDTLLRTTTYTYDGSGHLTDLLTSDSAGNMVSHTSYGYDETSVATTSGVPQHISPAGARGNQTSLHQWFNGNASLDSSAAYYDTGAVLSSTAPSGATTYVYDATQAFVTGASLPTPSSGVALETTASYDTSSASIVSATGLNAGQTVQVQQYDRLQRPLSIALPDGGLKTFTYMAGYSISSFKVTASDSGGTITWYDGYGRTRRTSTGNGLNWYVTDTCYGPTGAVQYVSLPYMSPSSVSDPSGTHCNSSTATQYTYDALGRLTGVTHPDNTSSAASYLIYGGRFSTRLQDESGVVRVVDTDALGRTVIACNVTSATQANGESPGNCYTGLGATGFPATYAYNDATHTTAVTQGVQTRTFQTDALGRAVYTSEPERGATSYTYQYQGPELLVSRTRPAPNQTNPSVTVTTVTRYDTLSRPTITDYFATGTSNKLQASRYFYYDVPSNNYYPSNNAKGLLAEAYLVTGDSNDASTRFSYDIMGRIAGTYQCAPGWCSNPSARGMYRAYGYDFAGNNTSENWTYGYVPNSPRPSVTMARTYNVAGELDTMGGGMNDSSQPVFPYFYQAGTHTPLGPLSERFGNGLYRNSVFDANGRDAGRFICGGTVQPDCGGGSYVYGYRDIIVGQHLLQIADTVLNRISTMQHDDFGRLSAMNSNDGMNMAWTYDRYGNRYGQTGGGGGVSVPQPQFSFDTTTNRVNGYSYDAAGNLTNDGLHTYTYDLEGNMVVAGGVATNFYDALNRRVAQSTGSHFERYEYNAQGQISDVWYDEEQYEHIARYTVNGQPLAYLDTGGNLATAHVHYQHPDYLGTVRLVTSSSGATESAFRSLPFGESYSFLGADDDRSHFAELEHDTESDTHHAQFRQYSSTQGRWMSPDPFGGSYDITDPQSFNRYTYVLNRPLSATDPSGLVNCLANPEELDPAEATYCEENPLADCYDGECSPGPPIVQQPTQPGCGQGIQSCVSAEPLPDFPNGTVPGDPRSGQPSSGTATGGGSSSPNAPNSGNSQQVPVNGPWTYGNHCGAGGMGPDVNSTDAACHVHDSCFDALHLTAEQYTGGQASPAQVQGAAACNQQLCNSVLDVNRGKGTPLSQRWAGAEIILFFSLTGPKGAQCHGF